MPRLGNVSKVSSDQHHLEWLLMLDDKQMEQLLFVVLLPLGGAVVLDRLCPLHFQDMIFDDEISDLILLSMQKHHFYVEDYLSVDVW